MKSARSGTPNVFKLAFLKLGFSFLQVKVVRLHGMIFRWAPDTNKIMALPKLNIKEQSNQTLITLRIQYNSTPSRASRSHSFLSFTTFPGEIW